MELDELSGAWKGLVTYPTRLIDCGHYFVGLGLMNHMSGTRQPLESAVRDLTVQPSRLLDVEVTRAFSLCPTAAGASKESHGWGVAALALAVTVEASVWTKWTEY
jgi:hypothetical protein